MTQFNLQEIYFTAPAKDYIGTDNSILNQSIQYSCEYFKCYSC